MHDIVDIMFRFLFQAVNLFWVTVFERSLFVSSWRNNSIIKIDKHNAQDNQHIVKNIGRPYVVHVFHRQRQPDGEFIINHILIYSLLLFIFKYWPYQKLFILHFIV